MWPVLAVVFVSKSACICLCISKPSPHLKVLSLFPRRLAYCTTMTTIPLLRSKVFFFLLSFTIVTIVNWSDIYLLRLPWLACHQSTSSSSKKSLCRVHREQVASLGTPKTRALQTTMKGWEKRLHVQPLFLLPLHSRHAPVQGRMADHQQGKSPVRRQAGDRFDL